MLAPDFFTFRHKKTLSASGRGKKGLACLVLCSEALRELRVGSFEFGAPKAFHS